MLSLLAVVEVHLQNGLTVILMLDVAARLWVMQLGTMADADKLLIDAIDHHLHLP